GLQGKTFLRDLPRNLLGAIYLQFAHAIQGGRQSRRCQQCNTWFELARGRTDRSYCSNACRTRTHRERQQRAREMHAKRIPLPKIARELETDLATVKNWIAKETKHAPKKTRTK